MQPQAKFCPQIAECNERCNVNSENDTKCIGNNFNLRGKEMKRQLSNHNQVSKQKSQRGQSLVEVALFFPIFIILLAGLVEVSQLLVTQNRVSSAARAATRFASNGGQDEGIPSTVLNTITQTLEVDNTVWDIWSIRATVDNTGAGFDTNNGGDWTFNHVYGISNTVRAPSVSEIDIQTRVLDELQRDEFNNQAANIAAGLQIVGTYAIHDVDSILGLDAMSQLAGFSSINALSVMRITANTQNVTNGCAAFPIAVREGARSVTAPGTGSNPYPNAGDFDFPGTPPVYESFSNHRDNIPMRDAQEGDVFRVQEGSGNGNFGWLRWNTGLNGNANNLANSLAWPGNSTNYNPCNNPVCNGQPVAGSDYPFTVQGYLNPVDPRDNALHIDDEVAGNTGSVNSNAVRDTLTEHVSLDRTLRLVVWDEAGTGTGSNATYRVSGFVIVRLIGYSLSQNNGGSWILAEFIRWDDSCGQTN
jgi:hypothetical protein